MGDIMKGVVYYFSGTGNTKWAVDKFKMYFNKYGIDLDSINLEKVGFTENQYDFLWWNLFYIRISIIIG
jgi:flavodoxin